jgi:hypothetical protein
VLTSNKTVRRPLQTYHCCSGAGVTLQQRNLIRETQKQIHTDVLTNKYTILLTNLDHVEFEIQAKRD